MSEATTKQSADSTSFQKEKNINEENVSHLSSEKLNDKKGDKERKQSNSGVLNFSWVSSFSSSNLSSGVSSQNTNNIQTKELFSESIPWISSVSSPAGSSVSSPADSSVSSSAGSSISSPAGSSVSTGPMNIYPRSALSFYPTISRGYGNVYATNHTINNNFNNNVTSRSSAAQYDFNENISLASSAASSSSLPHPMEHNYQNMRYPNYMGIMGDMNRMGMNNNAILVDNRMKQNSLSNLPINPPIPLVGYDPGSTCMYIHAEFQRLRQDLLTIQMHQNIHNIQIRRNNLQPIIIQNQTEVNALANVDCKKNEDENKQKKSFLLTWIDSILNSRVNQIILLSFMGIGCYMLSEHYKHAWRIAQLQRRVDSNILLRSVKMIEEMLGVKR